MPFGPGSWQRGRDRPKRRDTAGSSVCRRAGGQRWLRRGLVCAPNLATLQMTRNNGKGLVKSAIINHFTQFTFKAAFLRQ
jgi:hypothetical protein